MFIVKALIALVVAAIVYAILKPICTHFGVEVIWDYIVSAAVGLAYYFGAPEFPWKRP